MKNAVFNIGGDKQYLPCRGGGVISRRFGGDTAKLRAVRPKKGGKGKGGGKNTVKAVAVQIGLFGQLSQIEISLSVNSDLWRKLANDGETGQGPSKSSANEV